MAQLTVRNLDPALVGRLEVRAAQFGRSAEAEHRAILEACSAPARRPDRMIAELAGRPVLLEEPV